MIYNQTFLSYFIAGFLTIVLIFKLTGFLNRFFNTEMSFVITITTLFHPWSIDAFLAPNLLEGPIAFLILIFAIEKLLDEQILFSQIIFILAGVFNISLTLIPIYIYIKKFKELKNYTLYHLLYLIILFYYLRKHELMLDRLPLHFYIHYIQNIFFPITLSIFTYSLAPINFPSMATVFLFVFLLWFNKRKELQKLYFLLPFSILTFIGTMTTSWNEKYFFWKEVIFNPSSFMIVTFSTIILLALSIPKRIFYAYTFFIIFVSTFWGICWFPNSKILEYSKDNLPKDYSQIFYMQKLMAWQYLYEGDTQRGIQILDKLTLEYPKDQEILKELLYLKSQSNN
jgi:hypothetical protein